MVVDDFPGDPRATRLTASGRKLTSALLLAIGALVLGACTGSQDDAPSDETDGTNAETDDGSGSESAMDAEILAAIEAAPIPDSPAGDQLRFVLESIQPNGVPSAATAEERFHATFLAEVPPQQIVGLFSQLATEGHWRPGQAVSGEGGQLSIVVHGDYQRVGDRRLTSFKRQLERGGLEVTVRDTQGNDIDAACGQLYLRDVTGARAAPDR